MKKLMLVAALVIMGGCATQTFTVNDDGSTSGTPTRQSMQPFFVGGIGQTQEMDAEEICGGAENIAKVEVQLRFLDGFLGFITSGIYTPRTARVYCLEDVN